jgi:hypothetical protein
MNFRTEAKLQACLVLFLCIISVTRLAAAANETVFKNDVTALTMPDTMDILYDKVKTGEYKKIGGLLGAMMDSYLAAEGIMELAEDSFPEGASSIITSEDTGAILVLVMFHPEEDTDPDNPLPDGFEARGFQATHCVHNVCEGYTSLESLMDISSVPEVISISTVHKPSTNAGSVTSEGDKAMQTDIARSSFGVSGAGKKIGVLSDSFNCAASGASTNYAMDIASGDLPSSITVLRDLTSGCKDEGRAMLQLIHDVAPQAMLSFHTAFGGPLTFAQGIRNLADNGCNVIVDDGEFTTVVFAPFQITTKIHHLSYCPMFQSTILLNLSSKTIASPKLSMPWSAGALLTSHPLATVHVGPGILTGDLLTLASHLVAIHCITSAPQE